MKNRPETPNGWRYRWRNGHATRVDASLQEAVLKRLGVEIADRLSSVLREEDIAHAELAAALGVSRIAVSQWANGRVPSLWRLCTIAVAVRRPLADLLPENLKPEEATV